MATLPLLSHASADAPFAYRAGAVICVRQYLHDVRQLAAQLPQRPRHVLNVCSDRYRFAVGLGAALTSGKISLLPSTHTPEVIRQLQLFAPDTFCLSDDPRCPIDLPQTLYDSASTQTPRAAEVEAPMPQIEAEQVAAYVFTSGSTGTPLPYRKTWSRLVRCVRAGALRLGLDDGRSYALIATVPAQHMYGLESSVLLALQSGNALCAERPFYPADICSVIAALPRPRVLVATPIHLRALLAAQVHVPAVDLIVSATAPLSQNLAREVEQRLGSALLEIYGSTETGQMAIRATARVVEWQLWPDVTLSVRDGCTVAQGGHVEQATALCDVIEPLAHDLFLLHGRTADLVNIAGKRSSIAYLNHQLNAIPGVLDGAFFVCPEDHHSVIGVTRLGALVVAPQLSAAALTSKLRERIDPVFLPRPLLFVESLPRNATGKLPQDALQGLIAQRLKFSPA
jgi:acyl-coenzyme A synthetase/AMP-(fatty) acid ligase